jgi:MinD-like ATPase involved in chromosome partitioning or flagellar assembly
VEAEQPVALALTTKTLTEQRITLDTPAVVVRMQELAEARELVVPRTRVAMEGVPRVVVAEAALAVPVNQEAAPQMVVTDYLATSRALRFFMAVAAAVVPTH